MAVRECRGPGRAPSAGVARCIALGQLGLDVVGPLEERQRLQRQDAGIDRPRERNRRRVVVLRRQRDGRAGERELRKVEAMRTKPYDELARARSSVG